MTVRGDRPSCSLPGFTAASIIGATTTNSSLCLITPGTVFTFVLQHQALVTRALKAIGLFIIAKIRFAQCAHRLSQWLAMAFFPSVNRNISLNPGLFQRGKIAARLITVVQTHFLR